LRAPTYAEKRQADFERYSAQKRGWLATAVVDIRLDVKSQVEDYKARAWKSYFFVLSSTSSINIFGEEECINLKGTIVLTPDSIISGTNLAQHSFQVTCPGACLHARCVDAADMQSWTDSFTRAARASTSLTHLPEKILQEAKASAAVPETYQAYYPVKNALGIKVTRRGDWAVVSAVDAAHLESDVSVGSILYSINDKPVLLQSYEDTLQLLTTWTPPMTLHFFHPPSYRGSLSLCRSRSSKQTHRHLCILEDGMLTWQKSEEESAPRRSLSFSRRPSRASFTKKSPTRESPPGSATGGFSSLEDETIGLEDLTTIDGTRRHSKERNLADKISLEKIGGKLTAVQTGVQIGQQPAAQSGQSAHTGAEGGAAVRPVLTKEYSFISMLATNHADQNGDGSPRVSDAGSAGRMSQESVLGFNSKDEQVRGFVRLEGGCLRILPSRGSSDMYRFEITTALGSYVFQADSDQERCVWCATLYNALSIANGGGFLLSMERDHSQQAP
jgi:hypothetical protein